MGGKPIMALALLGMPVGKVSVETIQRIVAGGQAVCAAASLSASPFPNSKSVYGEI
jgi:selenide,water dikinase